MRWFTYILTQLTRAYKTGNISETVEDRAKATINGLYKVVHWLSIAAKMYDLEWPLSEIQGNWFLKCPKNCEIQVYSTILYSNDCDAIYSGWCITSIRPTYLCARALTYTYLHSWLCEYKTVNISETFENRAKTTINGRVLAFDCHQNMYDLEWRWPVARFKVIDSLSVAKWRNTA